MTAPAGILQFGDTHESILSQASCLTEASITAWGTGTTINSGATIDPVLGIKAGTTGSCKLMGHGSLTDLNFAGQFSFDVETEAISITSAATGSVGAGVANNTYLYSNRLSGGTYGRSYITSAGQVNTEFHTADTHVTWDMHSLGNPRFSRITFSWNYGAMDVYVNGRYSGTTTRITYPGDMWTEIHMASDRSQTSAGSVLTLQNYHMKMILLATQPVTLSHHPQLTNVYMFGDSYVTQASEAGATFYKNNASDVLKGELAKRGIYINLTVDGHSGASISDAAVDPLQDYRAALIAANPDIVIFQAGVNDANDGAVPANFQTDLDDHIDSILAGTTAKIFVGNSPSLKSWSTYDTPTYVASVKAVNAIIDTAGARWDAANPSDTGRVINYSLFDLYGGEYLLPLVMTGQINNDNDNYHPSAKGQLMWGRKLADIICNNLG